jgi:HD-GYP domain-containing protein (c-di-GMP phosphodiesterase class II)
LLLEGRFVVLVLPISEAPPGVKLAMSVYHPECPETELLKAGFVCDDAVLKKMRDLGIQSIYVDYPGFEQLDRYLAPQLSPTRLKIYTQVKNTIAAIEKTAQPTVSFPDYYASTCELVITLLQQGDHALYMEQLSTRLPSDEVQHATAVAHLSVMLGIRLQQYLIAQRSRLDPSHAREVVNLGVAGMLHDIGKVRLPQSLRANHILRRPSENAQRELWEAHPQAGFEMVRHGIEASAAAAILQHHERFDGGGFPAIKLKAAAAPLVGQGIHVFARIVSAADLFDRLALAQNGSRRPNIVVHHLLRQRFGPWIDPQVLEALPSVVPPFPPGMQVTLSDGRRAVIAEVHRDHPYHPKIRRLKERAFTTEGDVIDLWPANGLRVQKLQDLDVSAMYPPEKRSKKSAAPVQQAA